jgi:SOS-response transcriptional repressor LexA
MGEEHMTPRQQDIYLVVEMWWKKYGYSPSIDEIMMVSKDKSRSNVSRLISELVKIGACKRIPNKRRTLRPSGIKFKNLSDLLDD